MRNLDLKAAETAQSIMASIAGTEKEAKKAEDLITKALGVIQENGPYAGVLFLCSSSEKEIAGIVRSRLLELAGTLGIGGLVASGDSRRILESVIKHISRDTNVLLFVKHVWEQTLIYARHSAKSIKAQAASQG